MTVQTEHGPIVLACAASGIVPFIEKSGGDIDRIFGNSGIAPDMAGSPTLKLKLSDYCRLFEEASRRTQQDNFGLWFGNQFQPRDLGLWGYATVSSPTILKKAWIARPLSLPSFLPTRSSAWIPLVPS